jgi:hypothetical protein
MSKTWAEILHDRKELGWAMWLFCLICFLPFVIYLHVSSWIDRLKEKK